MRPSHARMRFPSGRVIPVHVRRFDDGWWVCRAYGETLHARPGAALNELGEALRNWGYPPVYL